MRNHNLSVKGCRVLIIDNYDSFTYNLYQYLGEITGQEPDVVFNSADFGKLDLNRFDCAVISPGPGTPKRFSDIGISANILLSNRFPVLGVCLGHQCLGRLFGLDVSHAPEPVHGRRTSIRHNGKGIFQGIPQNINVVRYHSLSIQGMGNQSSLEAIAWGPDGIIHGIQHRRHPLFGIQFHPESICSDYGLQILENFCALSLTGKKLPNVTFGNVLLNERLG